MNIIDNLQEALKYKYLSKDEKIQYVKVKFDLSHGKGKRKKKQKRKK